MLLIYSFGGQACLDEAVAIENIIKSLDNKRIQPSWPFYILRSKIQINREFLLYPTGCKMKIKYVRVQPSWIERLATNQKVASSNLATRAILKRANRLFFCGKMIECLLYGFTLKYFVFISILWKTWHLFTFPCMPVDLLN